MNQRKYELTKEIVHLHAPVHRIRALIDIPMHGVKAGDLGGFVEKEANLSHENSSWITDNSIVCDSAVVSGDTLIFGDCQIFNQARILGYSKIGNKVSIYGSVLVDSSIIEGEMKIRGTMQILQSTLKGRIEINSGGEIRESKLVLYDSKILGERNRIIESDLYGKTYKLTENVTVEFTDIGDINGQHHGLSIDGSVKVSACTILPEGNVLLSDFAQCYDVIIRGKEIEITDYVYITSTYRDVATIASYCKIRDYAIIDNECVSGYYLSGEILNGDVRILIE